MYCYGGYSAYWAALRNGITLYTQSLVLRQPSHFAEQGQPANESGHFPAVWSRRKRRESTREVPY
jgi:hypothetical protein